MAFTKILIILMFTIQSLAADPPKRLLGPSLSSARFDKLNTTLPAGANTLSNTSHSDVDYEPNWRGKCLKFPSCIDAINAFSLRYPSWYEVTVGPRYGNMCKGDCDFVFSWIYLGIGLAVGTEIT